MSPSTRRPAPPDEPGPTGKYVLVIVIEAIVIVALYLLGRVYS